jgi:hypothetical protein
MFTYLQLFIQKTGITHLILKITNAHKVFLFIYISIFCTVIYPDSIIEQIFSIKNFNFWDDTLSLLHIYIDPVQLIQYIDLTHRDYLYNFALAAIFSHIIKYNTYIINDGIEFHTQAFNSLTNSFKTQFLETSKATLTFP